MNEPIVQRGETGGAETWAKIAYILYLTSLIFGITSVAAVIIAYVNRNDGPAWLDSHYHFQIRTFWIGLLFLCVSVLLMIVLIGYLLMLLWVIWLVVRCIKGLKYLGRQQAHPDPMSWMF